MAKLVRFYEVGGPEVLKIEDIPLMQALQRRGEFASRKASGVLRRDSTRPSEDLSFRAWQKLRRFARESAIR